MNFNMNGELHNFCKSGLSKLRTIQTLRFACLPTEPHAHNGEAMYAVTFDMRSEMTRSDSPAGVIACEKK